MKKIAVVGGGIYGVTIALKLADKFQVEIFEKNNDILTAASGINQYRLHRGYHYPRSDKTAKESLEAEKPFTEFYKEAISYDNEHYYAIPKEGSLTSKKEFEEFCKRHGLDQEETKPDILNNDKFSHVAKVKEAVINPHKLREICWEKLNKSKVKVNLNYEMKKGDINSYDSVINCTYANLNTILDDNNHADYKFQLCEKPILSLPPEFNKKSIVVIDGPFMCIDPFGDTGNFVMGNVVHAVHSSNVGKFPEIPPSYELLLNKGIIKNPSITNIDKFIESCSEFIPSIKKARHIGSMFTIRTVLPDVEKTDERPILISNKDDRIINVFAGKLSGCILAADKVNEILNKKFNLNEK